MKKSRRTTATAARKPGQGWLVLFSHLCVRSETFFFKTFSQLVGPPLFPTKYKHALGASAVCVERDPDMAARARIALRPAGLSARVLVQDLFDVDLSEATVVYTFLLPAMNARLRATTFGTLSRGPGVRVISREFDIYGWPCGERFRHGGVRFLKWELPVVDVASDSAHAESQQSFDENLVVEHMLDCNAEESAMESGEHDSDELTGNE